MALPNGRASDEMYDLRERKRALDRESEAIKEKMEAMEADLIASLDEEESTMTRGKKASASITESEIFIIEDLEAFHEYCQDNDALYLLQNRPAQGALQELYNAGETVPGIRVLPKRKISLRKI